MVRIGILGSGNMGRALIQGWINKNHELAVYSPNHGLEVAKEFNICNLSISKLSEWSEVIVLSFLPQQLNNVANQIAPLITKNQVIISVLGGITLIELSEAFPKNKNIIRTLPNTNIAVNAGEISYIANESINPKILKNAINILKELGMVVPLTEDLFPAFSTIAGSSPAIVAKFAESLVLSGVKSGLSRTQSIEIVNQLILGTMKNIQEKQIDFNDFVYEICTPGGSTIKGIYSLEKAGFTGTIMNALDKISQ